MVGVVVMGVGVVVVGVVGETMERGAGGGGAGLGTLGLELPPSG